MGRQGGGDPTMVSSSIALLQERFRQLQKVRENREERELLKLFSETGHVGPTIRYDHQPNRLSFQPEMNVLPYNRQQPQDPLSLGLNSTTQSWQTDYRSAMEISPSTSFWPNGAATSSTTSKNFDHSDVDTSLHL